MTVGAFCTRQVDLADPHEAVRVAADRMRQRNVGTLVVLDAEKRPLGIITDRDLVTRVLAEDRDPLGTLVRDVMTEVPRTIEESASLSTALHLMSIGTFRRIPVVDDEGRLVGLIGLDDVLHLLAEEMTEVGKLLEREGPRAAARVR